MNTPNYRETRTKAEVDRLLHFDFVIPIAHGLTAKHVAEHYPGWTWNQLIGVLNAAGIRVARPGSPSKCHEDVVRIHFDSEISWRVEWADGRITEGLARAGTTEPMASSGIVTAVHDLASGRMVELPGTPEEIIGGFGTS